VLVPGPATVVIGAPAGLADARISS
jgi:hypothetical protein